MESANLKLPEQLAVGSSPPSNGFASFGINHNHHHAWSSSSSTPNNFSSCSTSVGNSHQNYDIVMVSNSSTSTSQSNNITDLPPTEQDDINNLLGFPWHNGHNLSSYNMQLAKIKEEFSESLPRFTELLNSPFISNIDDYGHVKSNSIDRDFFRSDSSCGSTNTDQNLLMVNGCDDDQLPGGVRSDGQYSNGVGGGRRGQFSQIYPSVNISKLNYQLYKPASERFMDRHLASDDDINIAVLRKSGFDHVHMQQPHDRLSCGRTDQLMSTMNNEMVELAKRSGSSTEQRLSNQSTANKKSRSAESRTSCPPFKVRKEKLGDRIAALQQMVSPFGKTDTASVLMEAIGYIKFLQSQVETLSLPYMKSSRNKYSTKTTQGGLKEIGNEEPKRDLRSRGFCLVPLSCMSYVTGDHGVGTIWPPPNFWGQT